MVTPMAHRGGVISTPRVLAQARRSVGSIMVVFERLTEYLHEDMTCLDWGGIQMLLGCIWFVEQIGVGMVLLMARRGWNDIRAAGAYARAAK